jgi:hypothetical protein
MNGPASVRVVAAVVEVVSSHVRLDSVAAGLCFGSGSALVGRARCCCQFAAPLTVVTLRLQPG